ncbi:MAG: hypothetical protein ABI904_02180 [Chloroflexota bacterium]
MAGNSVGSQVFAGRYHFEPTDDDWDKGRTGFTHPAFDIIENRRVVIKRADVTSPQAKQHEHSLQNEAEALEKLKGLGVPELYAKSEAVYGEQKFTYLVMEYLNGIRVEKEISSLKPIESARIMFELFRLLAKAHNRGIANGDIDLKHLFWSKQEQKLSIIDWGNASIIKSQKSHQFSFDMARSAEIIYALVTQEGIVPVTGSLNLPANDKLLSSLLPLPEEFHKLCKWAPRNPSEDMRLPHSALEMYVVTKKWLSSLDPEGLYSDTELDELIRSSHQASNSNWKKFALVGSLTTVLVVVIAYISFALISLKPNSNVTPSTSPSISIQETLPLVSSSQEPISTNTITTEQPTETQKAPETLTATLPPLEKKYKTVLVFDKNLPFDFNPIQCWTTSSSFDNLIKRDDDIWQFQVSKEYNSTDPIKVNFNNCFDNKQVSAIGLNFWSQRLGVNSDFGLYVEYSNGLKREYVLRTETSDNTLHLIVKDTDGSSIDYIQLGIKPKLESTYLISYYQYSARLFLELDNQGSDLISIFPGSDLKPLTADDINQVGMKRVDIRQSLVGIQSIGLISHGPDIQIFLWPLVFYQDTSK